MIRPNEIEAYEKGYRVIVSDVLSYGEYVKGRNGNTKKLFNLSTIINLQHGFPLLKGRKMYYKGVLGEFAAMLRGPSTVEDFEEWGCNYWNKWADDEGNLLLDYGNTWIDYNGINQIEELVDKLKNTPNDRRLVVNAWRPDMLDKLSLPCCHYDYQFFVRKGEYLDMRWTQRSTDVMIGLPSDVILGATWVIALAHEVGLKPGCVEFHWGDTHIYEEHFDKALEYLDRPKDLKSTQYEYIAEEGARLLDFTPSDLLIKGYEPQEPIEFLLKE